MNRYFALVMIVASGVFAGVTLFAQDGGPYQGRPHDEIMQDIRTAYRSLGENLEANEPSAAADNATRLEGFFRETEAFWARLETQDATGFAREAADAAAMVAARTGEEDVEAAKASYEVIGASCGSCHGAHRETIETGFTIKP